MSQDLMTRLFIV